MSGALACVAAVASATVVNPLSPMSLTCIGLVGSTHTGQINFNTDGTVSRAVTPPDSSNVLPNWYSTTTTGIGSNYWIKFTLSSGAAWDAGVVSGALNALSSVQSLKWTVTTGGTKLASVAVAIYADAGGTLLVGSGTLSVDIESNN